MIFILYADVSPLCDDSVFEKYLMSVSGMRREKAMRCKRRSDRNLSLGAGILLGRGLKEFGISEEETLFSLKKNGKPYIPEHPDISFSISHSGEIAAAAFSDMEIGCDIEIIAKDRTNIKNRFFAPEESDFVCSDSDFFRIWTLKESYIKALGTGLQTPLPSFSVIENGKVKSSIASDDGRIFRFGEFGGICGYRLSWCAQSEDSTKIIKSDL